MYRCLLLPEKDEIILLHPAWKGKSDALRAYDRQDRLVCPGCNQPVRLRAGLRRRQHFAHKHLANCPFQNASPMLLDCRALLYERLALVFGAENVTVEYPVPGLPRPLDALVKQKAAFWIIETRLGPGERQQLTEGYAQLPFAVHLLFVASMLHPDPDDPYAVHLTTTEREFMRPSPFDQLGQDALLLSGASLHYIHPEDKTLTTFRGLHLLHPPQLHRGRKSISPLAQVEFDPRNGEPCHPGELQALQRLSDRLNLRRSTLKNKGDRLPTRLGRLAALALDAGEGDFNAKPPPLQLDKSEPGEGSLLRSQEAICLHCGTLTIDWWYLDPKSKRCKCRECLKKGLA